MRSNPLFVRLSQLATQAHVRMASARAPLIQATCFEAASTSGETSCTSGAVSRRKSRMGGVRRNRPIARHQRALDRPDRAGT